MSPYTLGDLRKFMDRALKTHVVPALRETGFKGSYPHFRRDMPEVIDFLSFVFDRSGGRFFIEIGYLAKADYVGRDVSKLCYGDLPWRSRQQIVSGEEYIGQVGFWFDYGQIDKCVGQVKQKLPEAEAWWRAQRIK